MTDAVDPVTPGEEITLAVPRTIPVLALAAGLATVVPLVRALADGRIGVLGLQVLVGLVGVTLLAFGLDTALLRIRLQADRVVVRRGLRRWTLEWSAVKGVALINDGGVPRLRVVGHEQIVQVPAWSLRARHADGELEPAAQALSRFGSEHGVRIRIRTLTGPPHQG